MVDQQASVLPRSSASAASSPFATILRRFRRANGLTQEVLAERATLSARALSDLERGLARRPQTETVRLLADALSLSPADRVLFETAARGQHAEANSRLPLDSTDNLPAPVTPLFGRAREVARVVATLRRADVRLVTVIGTGGVGKTRAAIAAATELRTDYRDGVRFVPLASLTSVEDFPGAVAEALNVREQRGYSLWEAIRAWLRDRLLLLVLDNFEHLTTAATYVADLLAGAPRLRVLVTSRAPLHVYGEHEIALSPLSVPTFAPENSLTTIARAPAVRLFCHHARAANADFHLTTENAAAVVAICTRLDGLPLALELAAARIKLFAPATLLARLDVRLPELIAGARDTHMRQRTMRDTVAWSYDLLSDEEQTLFRRLAVFVGGHTLAAMRIVCDVENAGEETVLTVFSSLVDKSLVFVDAQVEGEARFAMLETIREYGLDQLTRSGEVQLIAARHATYFGSLAEEADVALFGTEQASWLTRLEADHDNLRAALRYFVAHRDAARGGRAASGLWQFWSARSYLTEGWMWLETFLALSEQPEAAVSTQDHYHTQFAAGRLAYLRGNDERAQTLFTTMLTAARIAGDTEYTAGALTQLGHLARRQRDFSSARANYEEALALRDASEEPDFRVIAITLGSLGAIALIEKRFAVARPLLMRALTLFREVGTHLEGAYVLRALSYVEMGQREWGAARRWLTESLRLSEGLHSQQDIATCLEGFAMLAAHEGQYLRALRLAGATAALRVAIHAPNFPQYADSLAAALAPAYAALGSNVSAAVYAAGEAMPVAEAIVEALAEGA